MRKEYDFSKMKQLENPFAGKTFVVSANLNPELIDYFKALASATGIPYQELIELYLLD
jgi:predicted DNA binding CopG/RHH family protein